MLVETSNLETVYNFALSKGGTTSWIYKLIKEGIIKPVIIDKEKFIDYLEYAHIQKKSKKKVNKQK